MKTITVNKQDFIMEFTFEASECKELIQKMYKIMTGSYLVKHSKIAELESGNFEKEAITGEIIDGTAEMLADVPHVCKVAFYAGLLENNPLSKEDAKALMKDYMKENNLSYNALYAEIRQMMETDGFFDLSGLAEMISQTVEEQTENPE